MCAWTTNDALAAASQASFFVQDGGIRDSVVDVGAPWTRDLEAVVVVGTVVVGQTTGQSATGAMMCRQVGLQGKEHPSHR